MENQYNIIIKNFMKSFKFKCECGSVIKITSLSSHFKTKKHINYKNI